MVGEEEEGGGREGREGVDGMGTSSKVVEMKGRRRRWEGEVEGGREEGKGGWGRDERSCLLAGIFLCKIPLTTPSQR